MSDYYEMKLADLEDHLVNTEHDLEEMEKSRNEYKAYAITFFFTSTLLVATILAMSFKA